MHIPELSPESNILWGYCRSKYPSETQIYLIATCHLLCWLHHPATYTPPDPSPHAPYEICSQISPESYSFCCSSSPTLLLLLRMNFYRSSSLWGRRLRNQLLSTLLSRLRFVSYNKFIILKYIKLPCFTGMQKLQLQPFTNLNYFLWKIFLEKCISTF